MDGIQKKLEEIIKKLKIQALYQNKNNWLEFLGFQKIKGTRNCYEKKDFIISISSSKFIWTDFIQGKNGLDNASLALHVIKHQNEHEVIEVLNNLLESLLLEKENKNSLNLKKIKL